MAFNAVLFDSRILVLFFTLCCLERTRRHRDDGVGAAESGHSGRGSHSLIHAKYMFCASLSKVMLESQRGVRSYQSGGGRQTQV